MSKQGAVLTSLMIAGKSATCPVAHKSLAQNRLAIINRIDDAVGKCGKYHCNGQITMTSHKQGYTSNRNDFIHGVIPLEGRRGMVSSFTQMKELTRFTVYVNSSFAAPR